MLGDVRHGYEIRNQIDWGQSIEHRYPSEYLGIDRRFFFLEREKHRRQIGL